MAKRTQDSYCVALNQLEHILKPVKLAMLDGRAISSYQAKLRSLQLREATIANYLRHLKAALRWAHHVGLLAKVPRIIMPKRQRGAKLMKGRPITADELALMLAATPGVVGEAAAPSWIFYLKGMWFSGLRLSESLELYWDRDDRLKVDLTGRWPMFRINAAWEKGKRDRLLPLAPEFAELLQEVPEAERKDAVFVLRGVNGQDMQRRADWVGKICSRIGKAAGVVVNTDATSGEVKHASLHDFRRAFGRRWAARLRPQQLMELMRHESINTTMDCYVGQDAEATAKILWEVQRVV
ncbi:MAG TPA: site-specific integrase [Pirellulaceae bacterium]|nr:site-specific integrase [Pirellulaceae bacterium]